MAPDAYNYEWLRGQRAQMKPWEIAQEMSPALLALVAKWAAEDEQEPTAPTDVDAA